MKKIFFYIFQVLCVGLCFWWLWKCVDWQGAMAVGESVRPLLLLLVAIPRCLSFWAVGWRLSVLFGGEIRCADGVQASLLCTGTNAIIPMKVGELVKIIFLQQSQALSYPKLCGTCLIERLLDLSALLMLAAFFLYGTLHAPTLMFFYAAVTLAWATAFFLVQREALFYGIMRYVPWQGLVAFIMRLYYCLQEVLSFKVFTYAAFCTVLIWLLNYIHVALLADCMMDLGLAWYQVGMLFVTIFFSAALGLSPGGIGVMEAAVVFVLNMLGVESGVAGAVAIFARIFYSLPPVIGALCSILYRGTLAQYLRRALTSKTS